MNPPFHAGNRPDHAIGNAFINAASAALKPAGSYTWSPTANCPMSRRSKPDSA